MVREITVDEKTRENRPKVNSTINSWTHLPIQGVFTIIFETFTKSLHCSANFDALNRCKFNLLKTEFHFENSPEKNPVIRVVSNGPVNTRYSYTSTRRVRQYRVRQITCS